MMNNFNRDMRIPSDDGSAAGPPREPIDWTMSDCPSTPPRTPPSKHHKQLSSPPPIERHNRQVARCIFMEDVQERLCLPDLGGASHHGTHHLSPPEPSSPTSVISHHFGDEDSAAATLSLPPRHARRGMFTPSSRPSLSATGGSRGGTQMQGHAVPWGDFWENMSHNKSQRHFDHSDMA